jgi:hypothetical protein
MPVQPRTVAQLNQRARQTVNSAAWRALTDAQRSGWQDLGDSMRRSDSLGQSYTLTGFQAYCSVNNVLLATGGTVVSAAPALVTPSGVTSVTPTTTGGTLSVAFAPTPLGAGQKVIIRCSPQRSAGRKYEGDFRIIFVGAAASTSPANILTAYTAKFGAPVVGNRIFVQVSVMDSGFESSPFIASVVVTA